MWEFSFCFLDSRAPELGGNGKGQEGRGGRGIMKKTKEDSRGVPGLPVVETRGKLNG